jgi:hypothetical protein
VVQYAQRAARLRSSPLAGKSARELSRPIIQNHCRNSSPMLSASAHILASSRHGKVQKNSLFRRSAAEPEE